MKVSTISLLLQTLAFAADFPNPENVNSLDLGSTPSNTVRVIESDHPYNADQNTMDLTYYVTQDEFENTTLFVKLMSRIEIGTSGTQVYQLMGFQDSNNNN